MLWLHRCRISASLTVVLAGCPQARPPSPSLRPAPDAAPTTVSATVGATSTTSASTDPCVLPAFGSIGNMRVAGIVGDDVTRRALLVGPNGEEHSVAAGSLVGSHYFEVAAITDRCVELLQRCRNYRVRPMTVRIDRHRLCLED